MAAPMLVVADQRGAVVRMNRTATRNLGRGLGRPCWEVMGGLKAAEGCPCNQRCLLRATDDGADSARLHSVTVNGREHKILCTSAGEVTACTVFPSGSAAPESWQKPTRRELEILRFVADGLNTTQIAEQLRLTERTVRTHIEHIREKFGTPTRAGLVAKGFRLGLLT